MVVLLLSVLVLCWRIPDTSWERSRKGFAAKLGENRSIENNFKMEKSKKKTLATSYTLPEKKITTDRA
jgi:hypothetical protein